MVKAYPSLKRQSRERQGKFLNYSRRGTMEHIIETPRLSTSGAKTQGHADVSGPAYQAYQILRIGFTVAPIVAGLDKFFNLLVNWEQYLPPLANKLVGGYGHELMLVVGVIEIIAGLGVFFRPKVFAYVVSAWLLLIVVNLLMIPDYYDVALRDFGLALGALALARLSEKFDR
jgi:uncharacterized membrane protein YphA (DoxX/SURF4 family)